MGFKDVQFHTYPGAFSLSRSPTLPRAQLTLSSSLHAELVHWVGDEEEEGASCSSCSVERLELTLCTLARRHALLVLQDLAANVAYPLVALICMSCIASILYHCPSLESAKPSPSLLARSTATRATRCDSERGRVVKQSSCAARTAAAYAQKAPRAQLNAAESEDGSAGRMSTARPLRVLLARCRLHCSITDRLVPAQTSSRGALWVERRKARGPHLLQLLAPLVGLSLDQRHY